MLGVSMDVLYRLTTIDRRSFPVTAFIVYLSTSNHLHLSQLFDNISVSAVISWRYHVTYAIVDFVMAIAILSTLKKTLIDWLIDWFGIQYWLVLFSDTVFR